MLRVTESGNTKHIDPVPHVERIPSKREVNEAFCRIIAALTFEQCDALETEVAIVRDRLCSQ